MCQRILVMATFLILSLFCCVSISHSFELAVKIGPLGTSCFFETVPNDAKVTVEYEVSLSMHVYTNYAPHKLNYFYIKKS